MSNLTIEKVIMLAASDNKKGTRVVAKVFYRILRKKGFSENQIINIATNILTCLIESLKQHGKNMENEKEHPWETPQ